MNNPKSETANETGRLPTGAFATNSRDAAALASLLQSFESKPDQKFLKRIVKDAADAIGADLALISRLGGDNNHMKALEIFDRDGVITEYIYDLKGTPCEAVVKSGRVCSFPKGVQELFPEDTDLVDLGLEAYVGVPLFSSNGEVIGIFCTLYKNEVTNAGFIADTLKLFSIRIASEIERSEAEERTQIALRSGAAGIWDWDFATDIIYYTPEFLKRIGLTPEKVPATGTEWVYMAHPDDQDIIRQAFHEHFVERKPLDCNSRIRCDDSSYCWVRMTGEGLRDDKGHVYRVQGTVADIDDLVTAQLEAQSANESKSVFLANMSHEIRTPMNAIMGMLQVLSGSDVSIEQKDWIDTAFGAASSLLTVLNDVLDLSRLEAGKVEIVPEPVDLRAFIDDLENTFRISAAGKGLALEVIVSDRAPHQINTDVTRVRQILSNFISNAVKFTDVGKITIHADVTTSRGFDALELSVRDTGLGIPAKIQDRLFERFEQADMSTTRRHGGSGLGLAICRELATCLGAKLGLESSEGVGSCFWLALPLNQSESDFPEKANDISPSVLELPGAAPLAGIHALVAEDNVVNQRILRLLMTAFGAEVTMVSNGAMAVERVQQESFDIVLMDVSMPGMTGYETAETIRALPGRVSQVPIVAVTAHAMGGEADKAKEAGMNGYIPKPIAAETLVEEIQKVLKPDQ